MKSPMLKRRLNPFLLATTILVLSILASLSVLYQGQLSDLLQQKNNLSETLEQRNQRISGLESRNQNLSQTISNLQEDVNTYISENQLLRSRIDSLNSTVDTLEREVSDLEDENEEFQSTIDDLQDVNDSLGTICTSDNTNISAGETLCNQHGHEYEGN